MVPGPKVEHFAPWNEKLPSKLKDSIIVVFFFWRFFFRGKLAAKATLGGGYLQLEKWLGCSTPRTLDASGSLDSSEA